MVYGYARVHRDMEERKKMTAMLEQAGAEKILFDSHQLQTRYMARSKLRSISKQAGDGDTLIIPDISHLHRRIGGMLAEVDQLVGTNVRVVSLEDGWLDTGGCNGELVKAIVHSLVVYEQVQVERHKQWVLESYGREPSKHIAYPPEVVEKAIAMRKGGASYDQIRTETGMSRNTVNRYMKIGRDKTDG